MATLSDYLSETRLLLNDQLAEIYSDDELVGYINRTRNQIAGISKVIRSIGSLTLAIGKRAYSLRDDIKPLDPASFAQVLTIRGVRFGPGSGFTESMAPIYLWPWEKFFNFTLSSPVKPNGQPRLAAVYNPGVTGQLFFDPPPSAAYPILADAIMLPQPLSLSSLNNQDTGIVFPWEDAVPYYAAYLAFLRVQRLTDARTAFDGYTTYERRAMEMTGSLPSYLMQEQPQSQSR